MAHVGDVAYGNFKDGFSIRAPPPAVQLSTTASPTDNGLTTGTFDLWVSPTASAGFTSNDNLFWNSTVQAPILYNGTAYATIAAFTASTG